MQERSITEPWRSELIAGLYALRDGEFSRAEAYFDRAYRSAPERPEVCFALGRERLRRGCVDEAEALLASAWRGDPSLLSAAATLARCRGLHQGRMEEARTLLDEAEALHGDDPALEVTRAEILVQAEEWDEAETRAERALAATAEEGSATRIAARSVLARIENARGLVRAQSGDYDTALFAFKRAADCDPAWSAPYVNTGAALAELGRQGPARAAYERAIAADPQNALAHYNLGLLLCRSGRLGEARRRLERASELEPDDSAIAAALAALRQKRGEEIEGPRDGGGPAGD